MRIASLVLVAGCAHAAPSQLTFTSVDSSKCVFKKDGASVTSSCDLSASGTSMGSLKAENAALKAETVTLKAETAAFRAFATSQGAESAALRKLIAALTAKVGNIESTHAADHSDHDQELKDLESAYTTADAQLQNSIKAIALTPGPKGATGAAGAAGKDGADGKDGAEGADGKDGAKGEKGDSGDASPTAGKNVVYSQPRTADNKQIWDDLGAGGRFCASQLGAGATFVVGTQALGSIPGCQACKTFNADKTCDSTIGTCHSYSSITCRRDALPRAVLPDTHVLESWSTTGRACGNGCCSDSTTIGGGSSGFRRGSDNYADTAQGITFSQPFTFSAGIFLRVEFDSSFNDIHRDYYSVITSSTDGTGGSFGGGLHGQDDTYSTAMRYCNWEAPGPNLGPRQSWTRVTCISGDALASQGLVSKVAISLGHGHLPDIKMMSLVTDCKAS